MTATLNLGTGLLACLALVSPLRAETTDESRSRAAVEEGYRLLDAGNGAGALDQFQKAFAWSKSPHLHYNLGQALVELPGRDVEAFEEFARYLEEAPDARAELRTEADRQIGRLRGRIAILSIGTRPDGVDVWIDDKRRGATPLARPLPVAPGPRAIRLAKKGFNSISEVATVAAGEEISRTWQLEPLAEPGPPRPAAPAPLPAPAPAPPPPPAPAPAPPESSRAARIAGVVVAATGAALGVTGLFVYGAGASKRDDIMRSAQAATPYDESDGNYETLGNTGIALMVAGGAAVVTGAMLYLVNRDRGAGVSFSYLPGTGGEIRIGGRF